METIFIKMCLLEVKKSIKILLSVSIQWHIAQVPTYDSYKCVIATIVSLLTSILVI